MPPQVSKSIFREIRALHRRRAPMNLTAMKRRRPELLAKVYALKPFVGWKNALAAAGISYDEINVEVLDYVTCPICGKDLGTLGFHLPRLHEVSFEELREEYPDIECVSEAVRAAIAIMRRCGLPNTSLIASPRGLVFDLDCRSISPKSKEFLLVHVSRPQRVSPVPGSFLTL